MPAFARPQAALWLLYTLGGFSFFPIPFRGRLLLSVLSWSWLVALCAACVTLRFVCYVSFRHVTLRYGTFCYMSFRFVRFVTVLYSLVPLRYVTSRYVALRFVTLRYVSLRFVVSRYVYLYSPVYFTRFFLGGRSGATSASTTRRGCSRESSCLTSASGRERRRKRCGPPREQGGSIGGIIGARSLGTARAWACVFARPGLPCFLWGFFRVHSV